MIGVATAFFSIFALHILCRGRQRTRFQTIMGIIMVVWTVWCAKDLLITFPGMYRKEVLEWIFIVDGWSALTYTVFIFEVVMPGWTSWRRLALLALPFAAFTVAFAILHTKPVLYAYGLFLWCYAWIVVFIGWTKMQRYLRYVRREYSNIDRIDVSWLRPVFLFAIVGQLAWLIISLYAEVASDIVYYISIIVLWLVALYYSWDFRPIDITKEESVNSQELPSQVQLSALREGRLEQVVEEHKLYLRPNLSLQELAEELNTNRTYVSNYLSQQVGQTFYDYINRLRIERAALPLIVKHPEYTFEYVAHESGFASISTFRRAFSKHTGKTPSQYVAELKREEKLRIGNTVSLRE